MADPGAGGHGHGGGGMGALLTTRWGPAPVWVYALGVLVAAWVFSKYRTMKAAAAAGSDQPKTADVGGDYAAEGQDVAPQFIIENNMPQTITPGPAPATQPSAPVATLPFKPPVVTPPSTTTKPPILTKPPAKAIGKPAPAKKAPIAYKVVHNDSLSEIAAKYTNPATKKKFTWQELWTFNTTPGNRPAATITTLKQRGPNTLFAGETILIPQ
jgi:LysM repeat protein